jgi:putative ABC transport system substrate-binding protein
MGASSAPGPAAAVVIGTAATASTIAGPLFKMVACARQGHSEEEAMRRREFMALVGASVTWPVAAMAQQAGRTYRLGFLALVPRDVPTSVAFINELRRYGFIEGQNLTIEYRAYGQHVDLMTQYAAELVDGRVDVIAAAGEDAIRALQRATKTIPIVAIGADLFGAGLVKSLSRPDGNTTGVSILAFQADGKRQDILIEAVPGLRLVAVLTDGSDTDPEKLQGLQNAARAHDVELLICRVASSAEIAAAIDSAPGSGARALNILASGLFYANRHLIMERAAAARLPTLYDWADTAEEGGFAAYGPRLSQLYEEIMPQQVVKLFRGAKIADIPVEQPTKFELVINLKTAKAMGVTVPEALLARADKVIE